MIKSKVILAGVIIEEDLHSNSNSIIRPTFRVSTFSTLDNIWVDNIYIVFAENGQARESRAVHIGDSFLVEGELFYNAGVGYIIFVNKYTTLRKKTPNNTIETQKLMLFDDFNIENMVFIKGNVLHHRNGFITINYPITRSIRGDQNTSSTLPIITNSKIKSSSIHGVFIGEFGNKYIKGDFLETLS